MAVNGQKERALKRRGFYVQEALLRRQALNEVKQKPKNQRTVDGKQLTLFDIERLIDEESIKYKCDSDKSNGKEKTSIYCRLVEVLSELGELQKNEVLNAINTIYKFLTKDLKKDNRAVFNSLIESLLKNENIPNSMKLVANFIDKREFADTKMRKALIDLRNAGIKGDDTAIKSISYGGMSLDDFLKNIRYSEYIKYEKSFEGVNLKLIGGRSKVDVKGFYDIILNLYEKYGEDIKSTNFIEETNKISEKLFDAIANTDSKNLLYKADLQSNTDLKYGDRTIIPAGAFLEVKKMDYDSDSYYSEYLSIYKRSDIPAISKEPGFKNIYNILIDKVFLLLQKKGKQLIQKIQKDINAIIFDRNLIVLREDIEFYWSNKGQRGCDEHRLSVRFRVKNTEIIGYVYDSVTHSPQLKKVFLSLNEKEKTFCPLSF